MFAQKDIKVINLVGKQVIVVSQTPKDCGYLSQGNWAVGRIGTVFMFNEGGPCMIGANNGNPFLATSAIQEVQSIEDFVMFTTSKSLYVLKKI